MLGGQDYMIRCSRCGSDMKSSSRYCMKCGNLNMNHPDNKNMKKFYKNRKDEYNVVDDNISAISNVSEKSVSYNYNKFTEIKICCILNIILYLLFIALSTVFYYNNTSDFSMLSFVSSNIYIYYISISICFLYLYAIEIIYIKLGYSWWKCLIPVYNVCLLSKRVFNNSFFGLLALVPIFGLIYIFILMYKLGEMFKQNGLLFLLLPIIYIPKVAYGEYLFNNMDYINNNRNFEKFYYYKKIFIILNSLILIIGFLMLMFNFRYFL